MAEQTSAERFEERIGQRLDAMEAVIPRELQRLIPQFRAMARTAWNARQPEIDALRQRIAELEGRLVAADRLAEAVRFVFQHVDFGIQPPGWREVHDALAAYEAARG